MIDHSIPHRTFLSPSSRMSESRTIATPEELLNGKFCLSTVATMANPKHIPLFSFKEGLRCKATPGLESWSKLLLTLDGRDKFTKVLQYACRLLAWSLAGAARERFTALKVSLTTSRKAFRLGRSIVEVQKLRSLGLLEWLVWYLREQSGDTASKSLVQSLSNVLYCIYSPLASKLTDCQMSTKKEKPDVPFWNLVGNALKMLGLLGFWAADNISFLTQSGCLDDFTKDKVACLHERQRRVSNASAYANRSYFAGAIAGLLTNWRIYWEHRNGTLRNLQQKASETVWNRNIKSIDTHGYSDFEALQTAQEKQFALFLALLKSCCDVLVFSNNPGIDAWKKFRGRPMHEGFHCVCGLVSAFIVLYTNYPNISASIMK